MGFVHYSLRISEFISNVELLHRDSPKNNFEVFELFEIQHGYVSLRIKKPSQLSNIYATGTKKNNKRIFRKITFRECRKRYEI